MPALNRAFTFAAINGVSVPIGNDLEKAGMIAANNACSDVYATGGEPKWADVIMIVGDDLGLEAATHLQGGLAKACQNDGAFLL